MKKQKTHCFKLLVVLHLLLFVYPLASKSFHMHEYSHDHAHTAFHVHTPTFQTETEDCPICDYELLSFVDEKPVSLSVLRVAYPVLRTHLPDKIEKRTILHFSLRAPPFWQSHISS